MAEVGAAKSLMSDATATLAELEAEYRALAEQVGVAGARRQVLEGLIKRRKAEAAARAKVRSMDELEKEALRSVLSEP